MSMNQKSAKQKISYELEDTNEGENVDRKEEPMYDEEQGECRECWPEQEFILAALKGDLLQEYISPCDKNIDEDNVMQPSREEKNVEISTGESHIFHSLGSSTTNCMIALGNLLISGDKDLPSVGNNSNGRCKLNGHSPILDEKGIYNDLRNLPESTMPTREAVHKPKTMLKAEKPFMELNDFSRPVSCLSNELNWFEVAGIDADQAYNMKLMSKVVHGHCDKSNYKGEDVDCKEEDKQAAMEEASSMFFTNIREIVKTFPCKMAIKRSSKSAISNDLGKMPSNFGKKNLVVMSQHVNLKSSKRCSSRV